MKKKLLSVVLAGAMLRRRKHPYHGSAHNSG